MIWKVEFDDRARKELRKLDKQTQDRILKWLRTNLATEEDPRRTGKSLKGHMRSLAIPGWRLSNCQPDSG